MKTLFLILTVLVFNSCGQDNSSSEAPSGKVAPDSNVPYTSYYVDTQNDLRACDVQTKGVLAYIKSTDQFMACLEAGWAQVTVKGKDGANGTNGKDGTPSSSNQWLDPVSGKVWVFTNLLTDTAGFLDANSSCTGNYRLPTSSEIFTGLAHGMKAASQLVLSPLPSQIMATGGVPYLLTNGAQGVAGLTAQFCIAK